jgi:hypothetical protein
VVDGAVRVGPVGLTGVTSRAGQRPFEIGEQVDDIGRFEDPSLLGVLVPPDAREHTLRLFERPVDADSLAAGCGELVRSTEEDDLDDEDGWDAFDAFDAFAAG